jgi:HNH endonuclease
VSGTATPRRGPLHVGEPKAPDCPQGFCRWCGDEIQLIDPTDYRRARRRYHYGDEHEVGDTDCLTRWKESVNWNARDAVKLRELEAHGKLFCAECGLVVYEPGRPWPKRLHAMPRADRPDLNPEIAALYRATEIPWQCDHRIPLEDGGPHHIDNLQVLCVACHRTKTAREATARADRRRLSRRLQLERSA